MPRSSVRHTRLRTGPNVIVTNTHNAIPNTSLVDRAMCNCPQPKLCELLNKHIVGGLWRLFQEDSPRGEKYRQHWARRANVDLDSIRHLGSAPKPTKNQQPSNTKKAWNFAKAVAKHAKAGFPTVSDEEYKLRELACSVCNHLNNNSCNLCGCNLSVKAAWAEQECPIDRWSDSSRWAVGVTTAPRNSHYLNRT